MSHLSQIVETKLTDLGALERAIEIACLKRKLKLELEIAPGLDIRGWAGQLQDKQYVAVIRALNLRADIGLAFIPAAGFPTDTVPIIENGVLTNGHFTLEADLMMLPELGPNLNLISNLYNAAVIESLFGGQTENEFQMELQTDNTVVINT